MVSLCRNSQLASQAQTGVAPGGCRSKMLTQFPVPSSPHAYSHACPCDASASSAVPAADSLSLSLPAGSSPAGAPPAARRATSASSSTSRKQRHLCVVTAPESQPTNDAAVAALPLAKAAGHLVKHLVYQIVIVHPLLGLHARMRVAALCKRDHLVHVLACLLSLWLQSNGIVKMTGCGACVRWHCKAQGNSRWCHGTNSLGENGYTRGHAGDMYDITPPPHGLYHRKDPGAVM